MRALVQRVSEASVTVNGDTIAQVGHGLLVLVCAMDGDGDEQAQFLACKIANLRIFEDDQGKMNKSVLDVSGSTLVVSQFTLAADTSRGNRPGFSHAAHPEEGERLYERFSKWNASTINGSRQRRNGILNNELYLGRITYNRQRFIKDPETGKRRSRLNPEHEWVITDVPALRIIDDDVWNRVQAIKARYTSQVGNKRQTKKRLLTGLVKCGSCGGSMTIVNRERYSCSAKRERGTCDSPVGIKAAELEDRDRRDNPVTGNGHRPLHD